METTREERVAASNEWMRRYIEEPESFEREWQTVSTYLKEQANNLPLTYGDRCEAYLEFLMAEARGYPRPVTPPPPAERTGPLGT